MEDCLWPVLGQHTRYGCPVADVPLYKNMSRVIDDTPQGIEITGIGQQIEIDNLSREFLDPMADETAADESSTTGNKDGLHSNAP